ncbi:FCY1 [Sanghuangporus sanghuang]
MTALAPFDDTLGMRAAIEQAKKSLLEGGIPIGSALVAQEAGGELKLLAASHNQRIQKNSPILHGETATLEQAGRLKASVYRKSTIYTTLSPCDMCTGMILLYNIPRVVIGENKTFLGGEEYLKSRGVEVVVLDDFECKKLMAQFIQEHPEEWNEDIGEP